MAAVESSLGPRGAALTSSALRFDPQQRFTCGQCARCCTRPWAIVVTAAERDDLQRARAERFFREAPGHNEGAARDPFDPLPGGLFAIRKRSGDGACGFLSAAGRCRLHEELGERRKPLACQVFPFRFHPLIGGTAVSVSAACPTVVRSEGQPLGEQARALGVAARAWLRAFPEPAGALEFVSGLPLSPQALERLRATLVGLFERRDAELQDLRANLRRAAAFVEDLQRSRVVQLGPERFADYLDVLGPHAVGAERPAPERPVGALVRLLFRGFLLAVVTGQWQLEATAADTSRIALRLRTFRLALHLHGLWPGLQAFSLRGVARVRVDLADPALSAVLLQALRRVAQGLGTGRRPVSDELSLGIALIEAGVVLAAAHAARAGREAVISEDLIAGLNEAFDLEHTSERGLYAKLMVSLTGGVAALDRLAGRGARSGASERIAP